MLKDLNRISMKFIVSASKMYLSAVILMLLVHQSIFAQQSDSSKVNTRGFFAGISLGTAQTQIMNQGMLSVSALQSDKKNGLAGILEIGYLFSNNFGLSSGIGFKSYESQLSLKSYQNKFNTIDSENETYERQVSGINITEDQNIGTLSIPVLLNLRLPFGKKTGLFLQGGIGADFPVIKTFQSSGTFTFKGYYPAYNVLLENLPAYGFPSNTVVSTNGKLDLKPVYFDALASAGLDFSIAENMKLIITACYTSSISKISNYTSPEKFQLSSDINQINSFMGGSNNATIQSIGVNISFRYYLFKK